MLLMVKFFNIERKRTMLTSKQNQILADLFNEFDMSQYQGTMQEAKEEWREYNLFRYGITVDDVYRYLLDELDRQL